MNTQETIQKLEERMRDNPKSLVFARLADLYLQTGELEKSLLLCEEGVKNHPSYVTGGFILSKIYLAKGDQDRAEAELKKVLSHDMQYLSAHKLLGDLMARMGWENKAAIHYQDLLRIDPLAEDVRRILESVSYTEPAPGEPELEEIADTSPKDDGEIDTENWKAELEGIIADSESEEMIREPRPSPQETEGTAEGETVGEDDFLFEFPEAREATPARTDAAENVEAESPEKTVPFPHPPGGGVPEAPETEDFVFHETETVSEADGIESEAPQPASDTLDEEITSLLEPELLQEHGESAGAAAPTDTPIPAVPPGPQAAGELIEETAEESPLLQGGDEETAAVAAPQEEVQEEQKIVSPTLGEIYAAQGQYAKAIRVYQTLIEKNPEKESRYQAKIEELQKKLEE